MEGAAAAFRRVHPREFYQRFVAQGVRPDGRQLDASRQTTISTGSICKADGSALVRIGGTQVISTVRAEITKPLADAPNAGLITVNLVITALGSPAVKPGRQNDAAASLSNMFERTLESAGTVDLSTLVISEDAVWILYCDICMCIASRKMFYTILNRCFATDCLDFDGNLIDASLIALTAALRDTKLPDVELNHVNGQMAVCSDERRELVTQRIALPLTFVLLEGQLIADPTLEEERLSVHAESDAGMIGGSGTVTGYEGGSTSNSFTVVVDDAGDFVSIYKPGGAQLTQSLMKTAIEWARAKAAVLSSMIQ